MDTPGFEVENRTKPDEGKAIEAGESLYQPESVARDIIGSVCAGQYHIACGDLGISLLIRGTSGACRARAEPGATAVSLTRALAGMTPRNNTVADMLLLPLIVLVGVVYRAMWDREVCKPKYRGDRPSGALLRGDRGESAAAVRAEDAAEAEAKSQ